MRGFEHALSLFFRGSRGGLALALAFGSLNAFAEAFSASQTAAGLSYTGPYSDVYTGTVTWSLSGSVIQEENNVVLSLDTVSAAWNWTPGGDPPFDGDPIIWNDFVLTMTLNGEPFAPSGFDGFLGWLDGAPTTGNNRVGGQTETGWLTEVNVSGLNGTLRVYWEKMEQSGDHGTGRVLLGAIVIGSAQQMKQLSFSLENTTDLWRFGAVFVSEYAGMAVKVTRIAPHTTGELLINVASGDSNHYYAAFIDGAASAVAGATQTLTEMPDGSRVVTHSGVVPVAGSETAVKTASDGTVVTQAGGGIFVAPGAQAPRPTVPTSIGTTGANVAATNQHLSEVGNSLENSITAALRTVDGTLRDGQTMSSITLGGIEERLAEIRDSTRAMEKRDAEEKAKIAQAIAANPTVGEMSAAGADASAEIRSVYGTRPTGKGYTLNASGAPNLTVAMPAAFGGQTFDLNPFQAGRFQALCTWFRAATAWLVIGLLGGWVWSRVGEWTRGFSTLAQARGNAVVAGTGAQGTALVAAGLITVAIVTGTTTILSWAFDDINFAAFVAVATTNPLATIPAGILWMLDQVLPVATIITAFVARITFNIYASTVFAGAAAVVRFIVP